MRRRTKHIQQRLSGMARVLVFEEDFDALPGEERTALMERFGRDLATELKVLRALREEQTDEERAAQRDARIAALEMPLPIAERLAALGPE